MTFLELFGVVFFLSLIWLFGYIVGYHVGHDDGAEGKPKQWNKTRKPPSSVVDD